MRSKGMRRGGCGPCMEQKEVRSPEPVLEQCEIALYDVASGTFSGGQSAESNYLPNSHHHAPPVMFLGPKPSNHSATMLFKALVFFLVRSSPSKDKPRDPFSKSYQVSPMLPPEHYLKCLKEISCTTIGGTRPLPLLRTIQA